MIRRYTDDRSGDASRDLDKLRAIPLLGLLDPSAIARVAATSQARSFQRGSVVALEGTPASSAIILVEGALSAVHDTETGNTFRTAELAAPCIVDKIAVLDRGGYTATWIASSRSRVRLLPAQEFYAIFEAYPEARRHILARLGAELRAHQVELVATRNLRARSRLAAWLLRSSRAGRVAFPHGQQGVAERLGLSRVTVNRVLSEFVRAAIIRIDGSNAIILSEDGLRLAITQ